MSDWSPDHLVGAEDCPACWKGYTEACSCGGRIHYEYLDESYIDGEEFLYFTEQCDRCDPEWFSSEEPQP